LTNDQARDTRMLLKEVRSQGKENAAKAPHQRFLVIQEKALDSGHRVKVAICID
jgi:hypothetical protein